MNIDLTQYEQYRQFDAELLRVRIEAARGSRSMATFVDDIKRTSPNAKISAPTLSRIINGSFKKSISLELLEAIADVADKDSGITFDDLAEANGYVNKEETDKDAIRDMRNAREFERKTVYETEKAQMIMQQEIASRGYQFRQIDKEQCRSMDQDNKVVFRRNCNFGFSVSGMAPTNLWKFHYLYFPLVEGESQEKSESKWTHWVLNYISRISFLFASDAHESELYENEKTSIIFNIKFMYDYFLKKMENVEVNGLITAILIDRDEMKVVEETQLRRNDGAVMPAFFNGLRANVVTKQYGNGVRRLFDIDYLDE